jgi:hypothetical protein
LQGFAPGDETPEVVGGEHDVRAPAVGAAMEFLDGQRVEAGGEDLGEGALLGEIYGFYNKGKM